MPFFITLTMTIWSSLKEVSANFATEKEEHREAKFNSGLNSTLYAF
jgi:hypothetical protein